MAKMTAWLEESAIAFDNANEIKVEVEELLKQFQAHKSELSIAEQNVLDKYQNKFDYMMNHIFDPGHESDTYFCFNHLKIMHEGLQRRRDEDVTSRDKDWIESGFGRTCTEQRIKDRKEQIKNCAEFVRDMEAFKDNFLQEINDAQIEKPELAAAKETVVAEPKAAAPVISKPVGTYHAAKAIAKSVYQTVKKAIVGTYHAVKAVVVNVIDTVKTNIEDMIAKMKKAVAVIVA